MTLRNKLVLAEYYHHLCNHLAIARASKSGLSSRLSPTPMSHFTVSKATRSDAPITNCCPQAEGDATKQFHRGARRGRRQGSDTCFPNLHKLRASDVVNKNSLRFQPWIWLFKNFHARDGRKSAPSAEKWCAL